MTIFTSFRRSLKALTTGCGKCNRPGSDLPEPASCVQSPSLRRADQRTLRPMIDLSIIIVNWKSADYLRACLTSVFQHTEGLCLEVIVVDNASGDGCEAILEKEFPGVRLIALTRNVGF